MTVSGVVSPQGSGQDGRNSSAAEASCSGNQSLYSSEATAAFATVITLMVLITIVGNILVIIAVLTSRSLRGPQNLFLVSLAAADILVATLIVPFSLAKELMGCWYFGSTWCKIYLALDVLFCTSSIFHLCAISLDRYLSISRAITYGAKRTPRCIKGAILVVWLISALISFPSLLFVNEIDKECELIEERWYILYSTVGSFFAPCLIMILVYLRIYQIAKQRTRCPPGEQRKEGTPAATTTPPMASAQAQQNGTNEGTVTKGHTHRPPSLTVTPCPSSMQAKKSTNTHDMLQPPSPAATPTTPSSPSCPSPVLISSLSSAHPLEKVPKSNGGKKLKRVGRRPVNNNGESTSSGSDTDQGLVLEGTQVAGSGMHSPASVQKYRDMITTSKGVILAGWRSKPDGTRTSARRKAMVNREKRFTFVLAVVIGVFVVCWFPFFFSYSLQAICPEACKVPEPVFKFFFWIGYCNSCLNPVIYTIFNKDFRRAFKKILCKSTKGTFF
ncbi:alpha-2B adrenergic receptor [Paramormyrops kingsleyae]|uniref:Alpha-2B adrenergic receptor n=1 Tax=Paramormyrops kingsleyae TaxID=1676925 RepID=A0A3B3R5N8_9TELE|nr:alpha-2B adrenergic receptor-like [Paramormyrops kingsleyae]XP_023694167.1 alpha-2B adrenergic receptor-like [Paramormyrops kingsleyae]XP_023694168.1 alpha-2B adrenergic receptor-like [Paramormyrops kingsleyae]XP_023694169.1 alpha-2B adrenergic receptor-like [Paramormyrops kingsleyae]XP_023694170.1 alpha-2B adrenergic receptor-like [Paramormyrops kingsleyae]XP_023694172.1 alpha-2B adrenergic receptor-like [Paramormyrops kingsleyae]